VFAVRGDLREPGRARGAQPRPPGLPVRPVRGPRGLRVPPQGRLPDPGALGTVTLWSSTRQDPDPKIINFESGSPPFTIKKHGKFL